MAEALGGSIGLPSTCRWENSTICHPVGGPIGLAAPESGNVFQSALTGWRGKFTPPPSVNESKRPTAPEGGAIIATSSRGLKNFLTLDQ